MRKLMGVAVAVMLVSVPFKGFAADDVAVVGKQVKMDYTLTVDNKQVETSIGKEPLVFVLGGQAIIPGLEKAILGMHTGEEKMVTVEAADAYGQPDPKAVKEFPKTSMPKGLELKPGLILQANAPDGSSFPSVIKEVKDTTVLLDFNHPLAGKQLQFKIKIVAVEAAPVQPTK